MKGNDTMSIEKIQILVDTLNAYRDAYYNRAAPLITDTEYDALFY